MNRLPRFLICLVLSTLFLNGYGYSLESAKQEPPLRITGSSTVFPFIAMVAENFGKKTKYKSPIVEGTGTGSGLKLLCTESSASAPDLVMASRPISISEKQLCHKTFGTQPQELLFGYDGIILAQKRGVQRLKITVEHLYKALTKYIIIEGKHTLNPYKKWQDIAPELPDLPIIIYGPHATSGTRDALIDLVWSYGTEPSQNSIRAIREDHAYIETGDNSNLTINKLGHMPEAIGIVGFNYLEQNRHVIQSVAINNTSPSFKNISQGSYPLRRPLYLYVRSTTPQLHAFFMEITNETTWGDQGYLSAKGLIPLTKDQRLKLQKQIFSPAETLGDFSHE